MWLEQDRRTKPARMFGELDDTIDLHVRQPEWSLGAALDNAAPEAATQLECKVGPGTGLDWLRAPVEEPGVKRARPSLITGVELEVNDWRRASRIHLLLSLICAAPNPSLRRQAGRLVAG